MLPIEYTAVTLAADGHEAAVDLEESGWNDRDSVREAVAFTLQAKPDAKLPNVSVNLGPLSCGAKRELVYFSRVFGTIGVGGMGNEVGTDLFRLYCIGWRALIRGEQVQSLAWVYPLGSVVMADEPPYINELIAFYRNNMPLDSASSEYAAMLQKIEQGAKTDG
jgi:hypothetical protein